MNLFWDTRQLTQAREDHLTCFIAACLEADDAFRHAYEVQVLAPLAADERVPTIVSIETQTTFAAQHSRPDMVLQLNDGRRIACEHKIDAPETPGTTADGETMAQLERYLTLPDIAYVAYFRSALSTLKEGVRLHPRYLCPTDGPHFLWRDLYDPLCAGQHLLTLWLRDGFERLGFTPPVPPYGELWPQSTQQVKDNQKNFGKLWHATRVHLASSYEMTVDNRCGLYLRPLKPGPISLANVAPAGQGGTLLRLRVHPDKGRVSEVHRRLGDLALTLTVPPEVVAHRLPGGRHCVDLLAPLRLVLGHEVDAKAHEARLFSQVVPVLDAVASEGRFTRPGDTSRTLRG